MRFIFKLLIGMIIFNAFLFIFVAEFGGTGGQDITSTGKGTPGGLGYNINSNAFAASIIIDSVGIFSVATGLAIFTKNVVWFGAGAIMAVVFALYNVGTAPIAALIQPYPFAYNIWNIITIVFGIIAMIAVVEIFTGRSVAD